MSDRPKIIKRENRPVESVEIVIVAEIPERSQTDIRAEIGYMASLMARHRAAALRIAKRLEAETA